MAWPFTAITTYVADSLPTIKAYDLNQLQAYINHLWAATRSLKKITIDGTGDAVTTAPGGDDDPHLAISDTISGTRQLVIAVSIGTYYLRLYKLAEAYELTLNAAWVPGGSTWSYDSSTGATKLSISRTIFEFLRYGGATGWADGSWVSGFKWTSGVDFISSVALRSTEALSGTTEPTTIPVATGAVQRDNVCHAWARGVQSGATAFDFVRGFNTTSFDRTAVGKYTFTCVRAADNHLVPFVQVCSVAPYMWTVPPSSISTSAFDVWIYAADGTTLQELQTNDILVVGAYQG